MRRLLLTILGACVLLQAGVSTQSDPQALQRMVATERAFAAATEQIGVRDGFLAFFAEDAVAIRRGAGVTLAAARDGLAAQPLPKLPIANPLIWEPFTGHVSADGTLGWLTGALCVAERRRSGNPWRRARTFHVWKLQPNGTWRVWLDEGIRLPQIWRDASPFRVAPEPDADAGRGRPGAMRRRRRRQVLEARRAEKAQRASTRRSAPSRPAAMPGARGSARVSGCIATA